MPRKLLFVVWTAFWIVLVLFMVEAAVRFGFLRCSFQMWGVAYQLDDNTLFRIKPRCRQDIGPCGNRLNPRSTSREAACRLLVSGDSFAFGVNAEAGQTISAALEELLGQGCEAVNLGVVGYGPDQSLVQLQSGWLDLNPNAVVLVLFPINDFNDIHKNRLFVLDAGGALARNPCNSLQEQMPRFHSMLLWDLLLHHWAKRPSRYVGIYRTFFDDRYDMDFLRNPVSPVSCQKKALMRAILRAFRDTLSARAIGFVVAIIPSFEAVTNPSFFDSHQVPADRRFLADDTAAAICEEERIAVINLRHVFLKAQDRAALYGHVEHHLSPAGYHKVAEEIARLLTGPDGPCRLKRGRR